MEMEEDKDKFIKDDLDISDISIDAELFQDLNGELHTSEAEAKSRKASDWFLLAARSYIHDELDLAITYFDKVLELEPENDRAYANRADVYADKGEYEEAYNDYMLAEHFGGHEAAELLTEFKQEMKSRGLMNEKDQLISVLHQIPPTTPSHLQKMNEEDLGDDMHLVDLTKDSEEDEEF